MLRPLEKSKSIEKTNGEDSQSALSKVQDAKSTIVRWITNKIFILICLSKGKLQINIFLMVFYEWINIMENAFDVDK